MTPWRKLITLAMPLAAKVRAMRPPKLRVVADGRVLYWPWPSRRRRTWRRMPPGPAERPELEAWLVERLTFLEEAWPEVKEVELLGVWWGTRPGLSPSPGPG